MKIIGKRIDGKESIYAVEFKEDGYKYFVGGFTADGLVTGDVVQWTTSFSTCGFGICWITIWIADGDYPDFVGYNEPVYWKIYNWESDTFYDAEPSEPTLAFPYNGQTYINTLTTV